jgi:diguanylate cyclase (GGDEF)-like protein
MRTSDSAASCGPAVEPRDERGLMLASSIVMWLGGAAAAGAACLLPGAGHTDTTGLHVLIAVCVFFALFAHVVLRRVSERALALLVAVILAAGTVSVWLSCVWSGGPASELIELFCFPAIYCAFFLRGRHMLVQLAFISALVLSPLVYSSDPTQAQFPGQVTVLLVGIWGITIVVAAGKRRLLAAELAARRQALTDPLTGVHNVRGLTEHAATTPPASGSALLLIDLDDFKAVNSRHGHLGADRLLACVARGLADAARSGDCVARIGGDEFAVLAGDRDESEVGRLRDACVDAVGRARAVAGLPGPDLRASVGVAVCPRDGGTLSELLTTADRSMYAAKAKAGAARVTPAERAAAQAAGGPLLSLVEPVADEPQAPAASGAVRSWWSRLPAQSQAGVGGWLAGGLVTLLLVLLPGADTSHRGMVILLAAGALLMGVAFCFARRVGQAAYTASDVIAVACVAVGVYLTGGTTSPMLPLVFIAVAIAASLIAPLAALARLAGAALVCATPMLYATGEASLHYVVRFVTLVSTATVLVAVVVYNRRELAAAHEAAQDLAEHDALTGLANRRAFYQRLDAALRGAGEGGDLTGVGIIDLDNFKRVNDRHGHAAGDAVLRAVAAALSDAVRCDDLVARIGGDEFALIISAAETSVSQALGLRCVEVIERAAAAAGYGDCEVSATVGFAAFPEHARSGQHLIEMADRALMDAKDAGKRRVAAPDWSLPVAG